VRLPLQGAEQRRLLARRLRGLYLNHLREAAYANLLRAEAASDAVLHGDKESWTEAARGDIDRDAGRNCS